MVPIVGVGCSAGGLEALERFFKGQQPAHRMAFVVVQHLSPTLPSLLPELLQRCSDLVVIQVRDGVLIEKGHVYVIAPDKDIEIANGRLRLVSASAPGGLHLSVDYFFRALAEAQGEAAVAVILSGMGSDGVLGAAAIKGRGGLLLVQDPASAREDSMPRAAIDAGLADIVALPEQMVGRIAEYLQHPTIAAALQAPAVTPLPGNDFATILSLLRDRLGVDFTSYKINTLMRRIERRLALHRLAGLPDYLGYVRANPQELDLLFRELLIGVTSLFRDAPVWELLRLEVIPALLARLPPGRPLRAWVPACSTGEEVYSLAIVISEAMTLLTPEARVAVQIYGTDLDPDAIDRARKGCYPHNVIADVSAERLARYFVEEAGGFRVRKEIREMVIFATQNIIADPPFTKLDILCCRNLLIYFRTELQKRLMPIFHYALRPGGTLVLGSAESISGFDTLFETLSGKGRVFRRLEPMQATVGVDFPARPRGGTPAPAEVIRVENEESMEQLTDQLIQQTYAPAAVLVNRDGDLLYVSGRTGKYLEPAAGKFNINIHAMAREGLREVLPGGIRRALQEAIPVRLQRLQVQSGGVIQVVDVTIQALEKPEALRGRVLIVFHDVASPPRMRRSRKSVPSGTHQALLQELQQARESQQVTLEEMQTSMEELRSSNEELQSTNEELQSTNEELTTSKEEMQSLNEELQTVNAELQSKVDDLTGIKNDMANLLNSTEIATIFLDGAMRLRRFTSHAVSLFKLIPGDVGRPISHVVSELDYPDMCTDAEEVLRTLVFQERPVATRDGRWYRVRIMPYRTQENVINGVVITFIDISEMRKLQAQLKPPRP